jgi:predicted dehydrogenase
MKNIVIIGFGGMGKRHALDMEEFTGHKIHVAAVCEPDDKRYVQGCEWLKSSPKRFTDIKRMLDEIRPDGAIIASPNFTHWDSLSHFKGRNIPLIIEKPLDSTMDKIFEIVRFAEAYPAQIMVHHVMRYSPIVRKARQLMEQNVLGKVCSFQFQQTTHGNHYHNFRRTMATGGGQLLEKATHDFDILLHLIQSRPKRVAAICKQQYFGGDRPDDLRCNDCPDIGTCQQRDNYPREKSDTLCTDNMCVFAKCVDVPDNELCMIELDNGVFGSYSNTYFVWGGYFFSRVYQITGTEAVMRICFTMPHPEKDHYDGKIEVYGNKGWYEKYEFDYEKRIHYNGAPGVAAHFHELLLDNAAKPYSPVNEAFAAELIAIAAYKANDAGTFVNVRDMLPGDIKAFFEKTFLLR